MVVFIVNTSMKLDKYLLVFHVDKYKEHMELKGDHRKKCHGFPRLGQLSQQTAKNASVGQRVRGLSSLPSAQAGWTDF